MKAPVGLFALQGLRLFRGMDEGKEATEGEAGGGANAAARVPLRRGFKESNKAQEVTV